MSKYTPEYIKKLEDEIDAMAGLGKYNKTNQEPTKNPLYPKKDVTDDGTNKIMDGIVKETNNKKRDTVFLDNLWKYSSNQFKLILSARRIDDICDNSTELGSVTFRMNKRVLQPSGLVKYEKVTCELDKTLELYDVTNKYFKKEQKPYWTHEYSNGCNTVKQVMKMFVSNMDVYGVNLFQLFLYLNNVCGDYFKDDDVEKVTRYNETYVTFKDVEFTVGLTNNVPLEYHDVVYKFMENN